MFRLDDVQGKANYREIESQLYTFLAMEARLIAERDQKAAITWPEELEKPDSDGAFDSHITADAVAEFNKRRSSLQDQVAVLNSRIEQLGDEIRGTQLQKELRKVKLTLSTKSWLGCVNYMKSNSFRQLACTQWSGSASVCRALLVRL